MGRGILSVSRRFDLARRSTSWCLVDCSSRGAPEPSLGLFPLSAHGLVSCVCVSLWIEDPSHPRLLSLLAQGRGKVDPDPSTLPYALPAHRPALALQSSAGSALLGLQFYDPRYTSLSLTASKGPSHLDKRGLELALQNPKGQELGLGLGPRPNRDTHSIAHSLHPGLPSAPPPSSSARLCAPSTGPLPPSLPPFPSPRFLDPSLPYPILPPLAQPSLARPPRAPHLTWLHTPAPKPACTDLHHRTTTTTHHPPPRHACTYDDCVPPPSSPSLTPPSAARRLLSTNSSFHSFLSLSTLISTKTPLTIARRLDIDGRPPSPPPSPF